VYRKEINERLRLDNGGSGELPSTALAMKMITPEESLGIAFVANFKQIACYSGLKNMEIVTCPAAC